MKNFKELEEKKNDLIERATVIVNGAESEKRELTDDEAQELAEIRDDVKKIKEELATLELIKDETKDVAEEEGEKMEDEKKVDVEQAEERAFDAYVRGIVLNERAGELTKGANGAVIPTTIVNKIIKKVYDICPILEQSTKYNVKGKLEVPFYGETDENAITVAFANEFEDLTSNVGAFTKIELDGYLAGALTLVSRSLINNSQFNLVEFIVSHMAYAIKRFIEDKLLNGAVGKVTGLTTAVTAVTTAVTAVTTEASTAITADEIVQLHDSIKDDFQNDAIWIMSPATRTALRTLKSTTGYYLLNDDISTPFGTSLLGKPVYVSDNMPDMGAGKTAIYYGDMKGLATKFAEEMEIEVLREKYATQHAIGVVGWLEFDGKIENAQMVKKLVMKA